MFAAHLAAGLVIKAAEPRAPAWVALGGAFLPDLIWILLAGAGVEAVAGSDFDGWSHSVVSILVEAATYGLLFLPLGRAVAIASAVTVLSHLALDMPIHPQPLQLYPFSSIAIGWPGWAWGREPLALGHTNYWWLQLITLVALLSVYVILSRRRRRHANLTWASCLVVGGLHLVV